MKRALYKESRGIDVRCGSSMAVLDSVSSSKLKRLARVEWEQRYVAISMALHHIHGCDGVIIHTYESTGVMQQLQ